MNLDSQLAREALQARLLLELMSHATHRELVLKGGLAMRALNGSVRHTDDIDLDADVAFARARVHNIVVAAIREALRSGLIVDAKVTEPKQTDTTMRWKIGGTVPGSETAIHLTVEVSRRARNPAAKVVELPLSDDFAPGAGRATVVAYDSQAIAATKVIALTDPKRVAPRDLYDLYLLIKSEVTPPTPLLASLPAERLEEALSELWPKISSMDYRLFKNEVLSVMPEAAAQGITEDVYEEMRLTVGERVQKWLEDARAVEASSVQPPVLGGGLLAARTVAAEMPVQTHARKVKP